MSGKKLHLGGRVICRLRMLSSGGKMDKSKLKVGDLIRFHNWGCGGFLFGVIIEYEDDIFPGKLNIWRPRDIYFLMDHGIDAIELIRSEHDVEDYEMVEFQEFLSEVKRNNIFCNYLIG